MDDIQKLILETYKLKPKHFTQILRRNEDVVKYVSLNAPGKETFLEQLYYSVYKKESVCTNGNKKKLKTFSGYSFCGKAGVCPCAKDAVSKSISATVSCLTDKDKVRIKETRVATTLLRYGVTNNGQIETSKNKHAEFYADDKNVAKVNKKVKKTKLTNHGNENYNNVEQIKSTWNAKYVGNKDYWEQRLNNDQYGILLDKELLSEYYPKYSVEEISNILNVHEMSVYRWLNIHKFRSPYKSTFEQEIVHWLSSLGIANIVSNNRTIIGKELDIFLPDYNLAIEYNGVYWHHDKIAHITKTYHRDKFTLCESKGIELFTIFSDSWANRKDVWKKKIKNKLGLGDKRVYARHTTIVKLTPNETRDILDLNHVQGYCTSQICYGLKHNDEIVAAMTFSAKRPGIGKQRGPDSYELVRFVTSCSVVGGASRLLRYFVKMHNPGIIYSYSDNQYSIGNLYRVMGFSLESDNRPGYKYYNPSEKKLFHRLNFTKYKLVKQGFDASKSESTIMYERGFLRIWDCGSRTWVLNV